MSFGFIMFCVLALQAISDIVGLGTSKRNDETVRDQRFSASGMQQVFRMYHSDQRCAQGLLQIVLLKYSPSTITDRSLHVHLFS